MNLCPRLNKWGFMKKYIKKYASWWGDRFRESGNKNYLADPDSEDYRKSYLREYIKKGYISVFSEADKRGDTVESMPYSEMLRIWGVDEANRLMIVRRMRVECRVFAVLIALSLIYLVTGSGFFNSLSALIVVAVSIVVIVTRQWRIDCLESKHYVPFKTFIRNIF